MYHGVEHTSGRRRRRRHAPTIRIGELMRSISRVRVGELIRIISRWPCVSLTLLSLYVGWSVYTLSRVESPASASAAKAIDSIVFVALGPASQSTSLLYALLSLREEGGWKGPVHVIVKDKGDLDCLRTYLPFNHDVSAVVALNEAATTDVQKQTPPTKAERGATGEGNGHGKGEGEGGNFVTVAGEILQAKMTKMHLLDLLPKNLQRILYVDCDVITQRPIAPFIEAVGREWSRIDSAARPVTNRDNDAGSKTNPKPSDDKFPSTILIFPDAAGHTVPICHQCDVAHSGVVAMERGRSELCLKLWLEAYMGDEAKGVEGTATDQEALDHAIRKGSGCEPTWLDAHHLRFMKDIFVEMGFTRTQTFGHFTGLLHPNELQNFHRKHYEKCLGRPFDEWGANGGRIAGCALG